MLTTNDQLGDLTKQLVERIERACVKANIFLKTSVLRVGFTYEETLTKNIQAYGEANDAIEKYHIRGFPSFVANGRVLSHGAIPAPQILSKVLGLKDEDLKETEVQMKRCAEFQVGIIRRLTIEKSEATPRLQVRLKLRREVTTVAESKTEKGTEPRKPIVVELQDTPVTESEEKKQEPIVVASPPPEIETKTPAASAIRFSDSVIVAVRRLEKTGFAWPASCNICIYFNEASRRCGSLHADITDPLQPLCKTVRDSLPKNP